MTLRIKRKSSLNYGENVLTIQENQANFHHLIGYLIVIFQLFLN